MSAVLQTALNRPVRDSTPVLFTSALAGGALALLGSRLLFGGGARGRGGRFDDGEDGREPPGPVVLALANSVPEQEASTALTDAVALASRGKQLARQLEEEQAQRAAAEAKCVARRSIREACSLACCLLLWSS